LSYIITRGDGAIARLALLIIVSGEKNTLMMMMTLAVWTTGSNVQVQGLKNGVDEPENSDLTPGSNIRNLTMGNGIELASNVRHCLRILNTYLVFASKSHMYHLRISKHFLHTSFACCSAIAQSVLCFHNRHRYDT